MANRRRGDAADGVIALVALMPWWAGVALGAVAFVVLHRVAGREIAAASQPGQIATAIAHSVWKSAATFGQYVVPPLCFVGAGVSAWRRRQRGSLVSQAAEARGASAVDGMTWQQFEMLIGEVFRMQGYRVAETGGGGADGGIDLVLMRDNEKSLVQCKQWRALKVGVDTVRELYGVMAAKGAASGYVVTSGSFTSDARAFADGRNIRLVDGRQLPGLLSQARVAATGKVRSPSVPVEAVPTLVAVTAPNCPRCERPMVKRVAKQGARAGAEFWGCTGYPECRGTRSTD